MTHGIDTDFLVAAEIREHPFHRRADALLQSLLAEGHDAWLPTTNGISKSSAVLKS
jgi:predicted nucleic acid-binding protein